MVNISNISLSVHFLEALLLSSEPKKLPEIIYHKTSHKICNCFLKVPSFKCIHSQSRHPVVFYWQKMPYQKMWQLIKAP